MATDHFAGTPGPESVRAMSSADRFFDAVAALTTMGVGSMPHRDVADAVAFNATAFDLLTLPTLPRRSPTEAPVAQALIGAPGVSLGQYGAVSIDVAHLDGDAVPVTDLDGEQFTGLRAALIDAVRRGHEGPVKWQFVGPISVGVTLRRAGVAPSVAFDLAARLVRSRLGDLGDLIASHLPSSPQLLVVDEPLLGSVSARDFPIAPDQAIDLLSSAMAVAARRGAVGVHTCGRADLATLVAAGPDLISMPARHRIVDGAGYLARFLDAGGWFAWGAVTTEGPIGARPSRLAREVSELWRTLAARGVDPALVRRRALITPQCGLGGLGEAAAGDVVEATRAVARTLTCV